MIPQTVETGFSLCSQTLILRILFQWGSEAEEGWPTIFKQFALSMARSHSRTHNEDGVRFVISFHTQMCDTLVMRFFLSCFFFIIIRGSLPFLSSSHVVRQWLKRTGNDIQRTPKDHRLKDWRSAGAWTENFNAQSQVENAQCPARTCSHRFLSLNNNVHITKHGQRLEHRVLGWYNGYSRIHGAFILNPRWKPPPWQNESI